MALAETLRTRIASGVYPIGGLLPTEHTLCEDFNVSRHTVREALRILSEAGLIARRRGSGTVVMATDTKQRFNMRFFGVDAVMNYDRAARLRVISNETKPIEAAIARAMDVNPHGDFTHILGVRGVPDALPLSMTDMYIRANLCPPLDVWMELNGAVLEWIAREHMVPTDKLSQQISADALSEEAAVLLRSRPSAPALRIIRRYFDKGGRIIALSNTVHPADRFTYDMVIEKEDDPA
jgi:DNA-binding GntR family transcriptional regulator